MHTHMPGIDDLSVYGKTIGNPLVVLFYAFYLLDVTFAMANPAAFDMSGNRLF